MSKWNRFLGKVRRTALKVTDKVEEFGSGAAASVRAKSLQIRIDEQYEILGKIVYRDLHTDENLEEQKLEVIATIDALFDELESLKAKKDEDDDCDDCDCDACEAKDDEDCDCKCDDAAEKEAEEVAVACEAAPAEPEKPDAE